MAILAKKKPVKAPVVAINPKNTDMQMLLFALAASVGYYLFSYKATGYYQHDEIMHYINMIDFWKDPWVILSNNAKPGYKLIYVLPALLGESFLKFFNAAVSAFTCYLVYKILQSFKSRYAVLGFFLLALQPYWIQLSFRNYADSFSGFVLVVALYFHYKGKYPIAALVLSYLSTIRQEFMVLLGLYGLWLLWQKKFVPVALAVIFPVLYDLFGYIHTGEPFYLITEPLKFSASIANEWPRQGFDHYFKVSSEIWSVIVTLLVVLYFVISGLKRTSSFAKEKFNKTFPSTIGSSSVFIAVSFGVYFLVHCLLNLQAKQIGASTGGNWRYMAAIGPCAALMSAIALDRLAYVTNKTWIYMAMAVSVVLIAVFQTYDHNNVLFDEQVRNWSPLLIALAGAAVILFLNKPNYLSYALIALVLFFDISNIKPFVRSEEDKTINRIASVPLVKEKVEKDSVYINHILLKYDFYKINPHYTFRPIDSTTIVNVKRGSLVIWETHYSFRPKLNPKSIPFDYLNKRPDQFQLVQDFLSADHKFQAFVFQKI